MDHIFIQKYCSSQKTQNHDSKNNAVPQIVRQVITRNKENEAKNIVNPSYELENIVALISNKKDANSPSVPETIHDPITSQRFSLMDKEFEKSINFHSSSREGVQMIKTSPQNDSFFKYCSFKNDPNEADCTMCDSNKFLRIEIPKANLII